jgi:hypothetical protein
MRQDTADPKMRRKTQHILAPNIIGPSSYFLP